MELLSKDIEEKEKIISFIQEQYQIALNKFGKIATNARKFNMYIIFSP